MAATIEKLNYTDDTQTLKLTFENSSDETDWIMLSSRNIERIMVNSLNLAVGDEIQMFVNINQDSDEYKVFTNNYGDNPWKDGNDMYGADARGWAKVKFKAITKVTVDDLIMELSLRRTIPN